MGGEEGANVKKQTYILVAGVTNLLIIIKNPNSTSQIHFNFFFCVRVLVFFF